MSSLGQEPTFNILVSSFTFIPHVGEQPYMSMNILVSMLPYNFII